MRLAEFIVLVVGIRGELFISILDKVHYDQTWAFSQQKTTATDNESKQIFSNDCWAEGTRGCQNVELSLSTSKRTTL